MPFALTVYAVAFRSPKLGIAFRFPSNWAYEIVLFTSSHELTPLFLAKSQQVEQKPMRQQGVRAPIILSATK
jgi:hypothetical protein